MLQVGDLVNQNLPPRSPWQCFRLIFCPSSFQLKRMLVLVVVHVVLVPAPLEEEGGGSQTGFGSGLLSECCIALFSSCNPAPNGKPRQQRQTQPAEGLRGVNRSISDSTLTSEWFCEQSRLSGLLPLGPWCWCRTGGFSATLQSIFEGLGPCGCSVFLGRVGKGLVMLPRPETSLEALAGLCSPVFCHQPPAQRGWRANAAGCCPGAMK